MMNRRASRQAYSKLSTTPGTIVEEEGDIPVVAESVIAVTEQAILPEAIEQGLTWTDDFFEAHNSPDIVAVFDYDPEQLKQVEVNLILAPFLGFAISASGLGFWLSLVAGAPIMGLILAVLFIITMCALELAQRHLAKTIVGNFWAHTAVTRMGLRHVQPSNPNRPGFALDIPFEDIVHVKIMQLHNPLSVRLTLVASTDDGLEYTTSGYCKFQKLMPPQTSGCCKFQKLMPPQIVLDLKGLKEPVHFKKVLMAMKEKSVPPGSKGAEMLCRVEMLLDSDHLSDPDVNQSLRELVVEMREFNNNKSSSIGVEQQHDVATIV